jgi:predicted  nucleic acid-binding Zn-ribbon protein
MENRERDSLEREVREHGSRIAQLTSALRQLEESIGETADAPSQVAKQVALLRMELQGRSAAFELGAARLQMI